MANIAPLDSITNRQERLVAEFTALDQDARYKAIIDRGRRHGGMPEAMRTDANRLRGCASTAWFHAELAEGRMRLYGQAEAIISNGLMALMIEVYDGHAPAEVLATPPVFIEKIGLNASLSANRANGLASMAKQITAYALAFKHLAARSGTPA